MDILTRVDYMAVKSGYIYKAELYDRVKSGYTDKDWLHNRIKMYIYKSRVKVCMYACINELSVC